jgi:hypothetical protein
MEAPARGPARVRSPLPALPAIRIDVRLENVTGTLNFRRSRGGFGSAVVAGDDVHHVQPAKELVEGSLADVAKP